MNTLRVERWVFTQDELTRLEQNMPGFYPSSNDEFIATIHSTTYVENGWDREGAAVVVFRNGEISNRYSDGVAGVTPEHIELAKEEEEYSKCLKQQEAIECFAHRNPTEITLADTWLDVLVGEDDKLVGWRPVNDKGHKFILFRCFIGS